MAKFKDIEEMLRAFQPKQVEGETRARIAAAPSKRPIPPLALWMLWTASVGALLAALFMNREFWTSKKNPEEDFHSVSRPSQQLWDFENGRHNVKVIGNTKFIADNEIFTIKVIGKGRYAVTSDWGKTCKLWDLEKGFCIGEPFGGGAFLDYQNSFLPDAEHFIAHEDDSLLIRHFISGEVIKKIKLDDPKDEDATWILPYWKPCPDGTHFIAMGWLNGRMDPWIKYCVALFDDKGRCLGMQDNFKAQNVEIMFSDDGKQAIVFGDSLSSRIEIDLETHKFSVAMTKTAFPQFDGKSGILQIIPNSRERILGIKDRTLTIAKMPGKWEEEQKPRALELSWKDAPVDGKNFEGFGRIHWSTISADGKILYTGHRRAGVRAWDLQNGDCKGFWPLDSLDTNCQIGSLLSLDPDGNTLYAGTPAGQICRLDLTQKEAKFEIPSRSFHPSQWIQFIPGDDDLIFTENSKTLTRYDWRKNKTVRQFIHEDEISGMALSKSGKYLLTSTGVSIAQEVRWHLWDLAEGKLLRSGLIAKARELGGPTFVNPENALEFLKPGQGVLPGKNPVLISPDESWFATAGYKVPIVKWDLKSGEELGRYGDDSDYTVGLGFGKDGEKLFSATATSFVRIYDIKSRELTSQVSLKEQYPQSHILPIVSMSYSPGMEKAMLLPWNDPPLVLDLKTMKSQVLQKSEWHGEAVSASMGEGEGWIFETGGKIWFVPGDLDMSNHQSLDNRMTRNENTAAAHIAGLCAKGDGKTFAALNKNGSICVYQKK